MISANHYSVPVASYIPWNIIHIVTPKWDVCGKFTFQRVPLQLGHLGALIFIFSEITMIWRLRGTFYLPSLFRLRKYLPSREKKWRWEVKKFSVEIQLNFVMAAPRMKWLCDSSEEVEAIMILVNRMQTFFVTQILTKSSFVSHFERVRRH